MCPGMFERFLIDGHILVIEFLKCFFSFIILSRQMRPQRVSMCKQKTVRRFLATLRRCFSLFGRVG